MPGEDLAQEVRAAVLQLVMVLAMLAEVVTSAASAAVAAAGGCLAGRCNRRDHGDGQSQDEARTPRRPRWDRLNVMGRTRHGTVVVGGFEMKKDPPGRIRPGGPFITICLHVRIGVVADVDVAVEPVAPHPARRIAVEVAVMAVVVVVTVVVVAVVVMTVMAMTVTTTVPAAGRRVGGRRKRGDRQRDSGDSGSEDGTLHRNFSWGYSRATIALGDAY